MPRGFGNTPVKARPSPNPGEGEKQLIFGGVCLYYFCQFRNNRYDNMKGNI